MKVLVYGVGRESLRYKLTLLKDYVVGFLETKKTRKEFCSLPVFDIREISEIDYDEIHIANTHVETIYNLLSLGIPKQNIVIGNYKCYMKYIQREGGSGIRFNFPVIMTRPMLTEKSDNTVTMQCNTGKLEIGYDYVREMTLKLIAKEILTNKISGDLAELGVFQGSFASLMNGFFPKRSLHLFDTFSGFEEKDKIYEIVNGYTKREKFTDVGEFSNTSIELVLSKMRYPEKCVIHKGYFPDTIPNEEIKYALVSLDCDLYAPMISGLRYFVPRMSKGGYIMMHDYNDEDFSGNKKAVVECEKEFGHLYKVPIPDCNGSLIISF